MVGDNQLTKILYARQLCGQYHRAKLEAFEDLMESSEERWIVFYTFNEELARLKKVAENLQRPISIVNGSCRDLKACLLYTSTTTHIQPDALYA